MPSSSWGETLQVLAMYNLWLRYFIKSSRVSTIEHRAAHPPRHLAARRAVVEQRIFIWRSRRNFREARCLIVIACRCSSRVTGFMILSRSAATTRIMPVRCRVLPGENHFDGLHPGFAPGSEPANGCAKIFEYQDLKRSDVRLPIFNKPAAAEAYLGCGAGAAHDEDADASGACSSSLAIERRSCHVSRL